MESDEVGNAGLPEEEKELQPIQIEQLGRRSAIVVVSDAALAIEGIRVGAQVRLAHLAKRGGVCPDTREILERAQALEDWVDGRLAELVQEHPAYPWLKRVKGTGGEAIGKVLGHIEVFGRFYDVGDPMIPAFVKRESVMVPIPVNSKEGEFEPKPMIWVEGIERFPTPSKLRKYAGLVPGQKRESGERLGFNIELRTMLYRLAVSLLRAGGKYHGFYTDYKERLIRRLANEGVRVLPTPKARFCANCNEEVAVKKARFCPTCGKPLSLKEEPAGVKWQGHVHAMAQHRMIQLFLDHLWVVWREALGLPLRQPYPIEYLGHTQVISPWDMVDRE